MPRPDRAVALAVVLTAATALGSVAPAPHRLVPATGTLVVWDKGGRQAEDVAQAVVWLESTAPDSFVPDTVAVLTEQKEFRPRVTVVTEGSTVAFPNNDGFNHNVFSLSPESQFDLGLYGRGRSKNADFPRAGLVRVYCNVHATMSAYVLVLRTARHTRPSADGTFRFDAVPPGRYTLKAWHERAEAPAERSVVIPAGGAADLRIELDARQFKPVQHLNKFGKPYRATGRRY
jgi:plastocyanin